MVDLVGVVAEDACQSGATERRQLFAGERGGRHVALVPVPVALTQQAELSGDQAVQSGADCRAVQGPLGQSSWQEVDLGHVPGGGRERQLQPPDYSGRAKHGYFGHVNLKSRAPIVPDTETEGMSQGSTIYLSEEPLLLGA